MEQKPVGKNEAENIDVNYGIALSDINDAIFTDILEIYFRVVRRGISLFKYSYEIPLERSDLIERLKRSGRDELRFGSQLSLNSKLLANTTYNKERETIVRFEFDPNLQPRESSKDADGQMLENKFRREMNDYLQKSGMGIPLPR